MAIFTKLKGAFRTAPTPRISITIPEIGASLVTRNCLSQDYCLQATLASLYDAVDEIVVCDVESTDDTQTFLAEEQKHRPQLKVVHLKYQPYSEHTVDGWNNWLCDASNFARLHLKSPYHLAIQADEVLHEAEIGELKMMAANNLRAKMRIIEFWRDANHCYMHNPVFRCADTAVPYMADAGTLQESLWRRFYTDQFCIYHYGFIRDFKKWMAKAKDLQTSLHGAFDARFLNTEDSEKIWSSRDAERLTVFKGKHPKYIQPWLMAHGYDAR